MAIPFILHFYLDQKISFPGIPEDPPEDEEETNGNEDVDDKDENKQYYWGVDSASYTVEELFQCVVDQYGKPEVWGRYLGDREGVSFGLDAAEIDFLHENNIQILVIYNHVNDARGYEEGVSHANQAIQLAENVEVPEGVAIFADIEPDYPVDHAFIEGWYDTLIASGYTPGIYGVFHQESDLMLAFEAQDTDIQEGIVVWTAYPQAEITTLENAPEFNPEGPETAPVLGWQYAIEAEACTIDTNLFAEEISKYLW